MTRWVWRLAGAAVGATAVVTAGAWGLGWLLAGIAIGAAATITRDGYGP